MNDPTPKIINATEELAAFLTPDHVVRRWRGGGVPHDELEFPRYMREFDFIWLRFDLVGFSHPNCADDLVDAGKLICTKDGTSAEYRLSRDLDK